MSGFQNTNTQNSPPRNAQSEALLNRTTPRYWCHGCHQQIQPLMAPDPTCPECHEQFVEEIENDNDNLDFMQTEDEDEDEWQSYGAAGSESTSPDGTRGAAGGIDPQVIQVLETMLQQLIVPGNVRMERMETLGGIRGAGTNPGQRTENNIPRTQTFTYNTGPLGVVIGATTGTTGTTGNGTQQPGASHSPLSTFVNLLQHTIGSFSREGFFTATGNPADYVYSQAGLDNIITQLMEQAQARNAPPPATEDIINSLPARKINQEDVGKQLECAVCKDEFVLDEDSISLPCTHMFHDACIRPWLKMNGTCPVCRFSLVSNGNNNGNANTSNIGNTFANTTTQSIPGAFPTNNASSSTPGGMSQDDDMWEDVNDP